MIRFKLTVRINGEKRQHMTKAASRAEAEAKIARAYTKQHFVVLDCVEAKKG